MREVVDFDQPERESDGVDWCECRESVSLSTGQQQSSSRMVQEVLQREHLLRPLLTVAQPLSPPHPCKRPMAYDNGGMPITTPFVAPSTDADSQRLSPRICVTVEARQKRMIETQCAREHRTMCDVTRLALRLYYKGKDEFGRPNTTNQSRA